MGTRNVTYVQHEDTYRIAQYGQWDGYPESLGVKLLDILTSIDLDSFKQKVSVLPVITEDQIKVVNATENWPSVYPWLSRDCSGADLIGLLMKDQVPYVILDTDFAGDSLMCEWAYVVDLDKNTFEVYAGFNKAPLTEGDRFYSLPVTDSGYTQCRLIASWPLDQMPMRDEFMATCDPESEEA